MSTETDRLAREAEQRRSSLDQTLENLKGKLSVGQIVDELSDYVREGQGADMVRNLNNQVRDNPLALGLIGAGAAWLLLGQGVRDNARSATRRVSERYDDWRGENTRDWDTGGWAEDDRDNRFEGAGSAARFEGDRTRGVTSGGYPGSAGGSSSSSIGSSLSGAASSVRSGASSAASGVGSAASNAASSVGSAASGAASSVGSAASNAAGAVSDAASRAGSAISDAASSASDRANQLSHDARDAAYRAGDASYRTLSQAGDRAAYYGRRARRTFLDTLQDEPLVLGAVAVAIGAAIGAALPSTRTEDEWLGETRDRLRDEAVGYGREALDKAGTVAQKAYEAGSAEAEAKGLKPEGGSGETLAEKVSSVAQAAYGTAKEEAKKESKS
ncbi:DUF3618 domain-containing protein [Aureimonas sp. ME7]|uniref:DUF3618 domain-containing protein n=1 Tax=Aureimonas sp. ME7 TaxID=2744252 RepID=UPI0015F4D1E5|nr:DUF3618 domain-containing protein [Aureimonas sp. ME7]